MSSPTPRYGAYRPPQSRRRSSTPGIAQVARGRHGYEARGNAQDVELPEATVREALEHLDPLRDELFSAGQALIVQLLVHRVDLKPGGLELRLRTQGLGQVVQDLGAIGDRLPRAA